MNILQSHSFKGETEQKMPCFKSTTMCISGGTSGQVKNEQLYIGLSEGQLSLLPCGFLLTNHCPLHKSCDGLGDDLRPSHKELCDFIQRNYITSQYTVVELVPSIYRPSVYWLPLSISQVVEVIIKITEAKCAQYSLNTTGFKNNLQVLSTATNARKYKHNK